MKTITIEEFKKNLSPGYVLMPGGGAASKPLAIQLTQLRLANLRARTGGFGDYAVGHSPVRHGGLLRVRLTRLWAAETPIKEQSKGSWKEFYARMRQNFDFNSSNILADGLFVLRREEN